MAAYARRVIEAWRIEYNTKRAHNSRGALTPEQYAESLTLLQPSGVSRPSQHPTSCYITWNDISITNYQFLAIAPFFSYKRSRER
jgi:hypothetical protein